MIQFDHIAIAVHRMTEAPPLLVGTLGGTPTGDGGPSAAYTWGQWRFDGGGRLEILEPRGDDGFLHRFLAARGPGVHHVTFKVPDLYQVCARAEAHGYRIVGFDDADPEWAEAFLHPKEALGIVVQMAQGGGVSRFAPPPGPPDPPPPVTVIGLRTSARSAERADTQWAVVLGAERGRGADGTLVYRWPDSFMRIAVEIDADADEGPLAVEFVSARAVDVPDTPDPRLGVVFRGMTP